MLLPEQEEENQSKKERKKTLGTIVDLLEVKTKGSFHQLLPEFAAHDTVAFKSSSMAKIILLPFFYFFLNLT